MGQPMALNLARAGVPLTVWNRTASRSAPLSQIGASVASTVGEVFCAAEEAVILMLADEASNDAVLRPEGRVRTEVRGRTIINMGTFEPGYSQRLAEAVASSGGAYVEAPVSGSRGSAETGELVAMIAGAPKSLSYAERLIKPMCSNIFRCGPPPSALRMKLAVNLYLITMVTALAEAANLARRSGLDVDVFAEVLSAGPMSSAVSRTKLKKLLSSDYEPQAKIADVLKNARLVVETANESRSHAPMIRAAAELYGTADHHGLSEKDMISVSKVYAARSDEAGSSHEPMPHGGCP